MKSLARKQLIINADGYGFTPGVNDGIVKTLEFGLVTSTSCTPNFGYMGSANIIQKNFPNVSFGIHFNLSVGPCVSSPGKIRSLLGEDDKFVGDDLLSRILRGQAKVTEMEIELSAQAALLADQGVQISHWDGHQNKHLWPMYFEAGARVAKRFAIRGIRTHRRALYTNSGPLGIMQSINYYTMNPKRIATHIGGYMRTKRAEKIGFAAADRLITPGYADDSHKSMSRFWFALAKTLPDGISEVYCHPGFPDDLLRANAKYVDERAKEVGVLTDMALKSAFAATKIELINFFDLASVRLS